MSYFPGLNRHAGRSSCENRATHFRRSFRATAPDGSSFAGCRACRVAPVERQKPEGFCGIGAQYDGSVHACVRPNRVAAIRRFARRPHGLRWPATATVASAHLRLLDGSRLRCHCRHDIDMIPKRLRIPVSRPGSGTRGCPLAPRLVPRSIARAPRVQH
jgi:hypothetical protein